MKGRITIPPHSKGMWVENGINRACLIDHNGKTNTDIVFNQSTGVPTSYKVYFIPLELV